MHTQGLFLLSNGHARNLCPNELHVLKSRAHTVSVRCVVIVRVTIVVHIAEISR